MDSQKIHMFDYLTSGILPKELSYSTKSTRHNFKKYASSYQLGEENQLYKESKLIFIICRFGMYFNFTRSKGQTERLACFGIHREKLLSLCLILNTVGLNATTR